MTDLKKVVLYGEAGRRFGKYWTLDVGTPAEALRAVSANCPAFIDYMLECEEKGTRFKILRGHEPMTQIDQFRAPISAREVIRFVPVISGAGDGKAILTIGVGIALIAFGQAEGVSFLGISGSSIATFGVGLVFSGVSQLLAPKPQQPTAQQENKPSFAFNGPVNVILQGGRVPLCYGGPIIVGSYVISGGMTAVDISVSPPIWPGKLSGIGGKVHF